MRIALTLLQLAPSCCLYHICLLSNYLILFMPENQKATISNLNHEEHTDNHNAAAILVA